MDFERTLETKRLRLLRLVAGLIVLLGFVSVGPVSRVFTGAVCGFVGSILSRAEACAQYMVIVQARLMVARNGMNWDRSRFSEPLARVFLAEETDVSLSECRARLRALRALLLNLPRHALRLIRRIERQMRRAAQTKQTSPCPAGHPFAWLCEWHLAAIRIERPPDKIRAAFPLISPPPDCRAGGAGR